MNKVVLLAVLATLLLPGAAGAQERRGGVVIEDVDASKYPTVRMEVTVPSSVSDRTLPPDSFSVEEKGATKPVSVARIKGDQLDVVVLLDTTGSMGGEPIAEAKVAAARFLQRLPAGTSVAVLGYDTRTTVVSEFSTDTGTHVNAIAGLEADGETALYDAVVAAVAQFKGREAQQRAVVLLTDGEDNASRTALSNAVSVLGASGVTLYGIEYRTAFTDQAGLGRLVGATDGRVVRADDPRGLGRVYSEIAAELSNHYTLTYRSSASGSTDVRLLVTTADGVAQATRTVALPAAAPAPASPVAKPAPAAPRGERVQLTWYSHPVALGVGAGAVFVALTVVLLALIVPGSKKGQRVRLSGRSGGGSAGSSLPGVSAMAQNLAQSVERTLERRGKRRSLAAHLEQAGVALRPGEFGVLVICAMIVVGVMALVASNVVGMLIAVAAVAVGARAFVILRAQRRRRKFGEQIADTLQLLAGSLRAGYGLMQAIDTVVREAPNPTAEEYRRLLIETRLGRDLDVALEEMAERIQLDDFTWVVQAFAIHREVGGDLAAVLDSITETVRERDGIRRQIEVLSAEGKLSMWILLALPIVTAGAVSLVQPGYVATLTGHPFGRVMLFGGLSLMTIGAIWIRRVVRLVF